jgi:hypothetical protein
VHTKKKFHICVILTVSEHPAPTCMFFRPETGGSPIS